MTFSPCRHSGQWQARSLQRDRGGSPADLQFKKFTIWKPVWVEIYLFWGEVFHPSSHVMGELGQVSGRQLLARTWTKDQRHALDKIILIDRSAITRWVNRWTKKIKTMLKIAHIDRSIISRWTKDPHDAQDNSHRPIHYQRQTQCLVSGFATLPLSFPPINFSSFTFLNFLGQNWIS